jgi:hypothetical protein
VCSTSNIGGKRHKYEPPFGRAVDDEPVFARATERAVPDPANWPVDRIGCIELRISVSVTTTRTVIGRSEGR